MRKILLPTLLATGAVIGVAQSTPVLARIAPPDPVVNGSTLSWDSVAGAEGYNVYLNDDYLTTVETTSYDAPESGSYSLTSFDKDTDPTSYSVNSESVTVSVSAPTPTPAPPDSSPDTEYETTFYDGFDGSDLSSNFDVTSWQTPGRDVTFSTRPCSQADGKLRLAIEQVGDQRLSCFLASNRSNFGPGDDSTMKIEFRADVSQVEAEGAWFAGWLYVVDGDGPFDGRLDTGMEIDVFEYMPTWDTAYNAAIHDGSPSNSKWVTPSSTFGVDLDDPGYHTYGVEWNKHCQVFTFDGEPVFTNRTHVSIAEVHSVMLTMEAETGTQWGYWDVGSFEDNLAADGAVGLVDWVRVSEKDGASSDICSA